MLRLLARDKQLEQTLGDMPAVRTELEARGLPMSAYPERAGRGGDVLRGLGRAARDALSTSQASDGARYMALSRLREQLPPPYQQAMDEVERVLRLQHFAPGSVVLGGFDSLTFGVPLGFYYLAVGTGQGLSSLAQGHYEQASARADARGTAGDLVRGWPRHTSPVRNPWHPRHRAGRNPRASAPGVHARAESSVGSPAGRGGRAGIAARPAGPPGSGPLRGHGGHGRGPGAARSPGGRGPGSGVDVASETPASGARDGEGGTGKKPQKDGIRGGRHGTCSREALPTERSGGLASLVDESAGLTPEVVEARLTLVEHGAAGPRLPKDVALLERQRPSLDSPPPGAEGTPRWARVRRLLREASRGTQAGHGRRRASALGGLRTDVGMVRPRAGLRAHHGGVTARGCRIARARAAFSGTSTGPASRRHVGVTKPGSGLRFADVLVIEEGELGGRPPRVETFSFKSRNLR